MPRDLETQLRQLGVDYRNEAPEIVPDEIDTRRSRDESGRRRARARRHQRLVATAAASIVAVGLAGVLLVTSRTSPTETSATLAAPTETSPTAIKPTAGTAGSASTPDVPVKTSLPAPTQPTAGSIPSPSETTATSIQSTTEPTPVITAFEADTIEEASIVGQLLEENDCLYLETADLGIGVPIFLHGTTWDAATASVVNADGTSVPVGQPLNLAGGGHDLNGIAPHFVTDKGAAEAQRCGSLVGTETAWIIGYLE